LDQGYRNIALISGPLDWWEARERKKGWADTLTAAGLPPTEAQVQAGDTLWSAESAEVAFLKLLETYPQMDAVFACSDYMALKVLQVAQRLGKRIPQDLGVIGYDGIQEAAYYSPSLSTINHDHINLGIQSIRSLVQHLDQPSKRQEKTYLDDAILLEPSLVVRGSTAA
jgi:LacI family transcriptional regulator